MNIMTARYGEIEIDMAGVITFGGGLIGFPDYKRYVILPFMEGTEFRLLQAVDQPGLGFITVDPFLFMPEYHFDISDAMQEELCITSPEQIEVMVIVTIPENNPEGMTANLQGPIILNRERQLAAQLVLQGDEYHTKHRIFEKEEQ